jgi:hypothetical protein
MAFHNIFFFAFLHRPQKLSFLRETSRTHIYYGDIYVEFFVKKFQHFQICFFVVEAYAPGAELSLWHPHLNLTHELQELPIEYSSI